MSQTVRGWWAVVLLLGMSFSLQAQLVEERPTFYVPTRPPTRQEVDGRESLKRYALGLLCEREDRLIEAITAFEKAARLNPEAAASFKALIPLYLAVDRGSEALTATRKVLDLEPGDYEVWFIYARQLRGQGQLEQARAALARGLACPGLADRPELALQIHQDLGQMYEAAQEYARAAAEFAKAAGILDHPDALLEVGPYSPQEIALRAADLYERIGRVCLQARNFDQAAAAFRKAQGKLPDGGGRLNYNLACICRDQGKPAEALGYVDAYLRLQPQGTEAYELKIALLQSLQREPEIIAWLEQASARDHLNVALKLLLAGQYARSHRSEQAERLYQELAAQSPSADVYRGLFHLYKDAGRPGMERALALLNKSLGTPDAKEKAPAAAPTQARAIIAALRDDPALAGELFQVALPRLERDELRYETLHFLAILADRQKRPAEAERFYRQCLPRVTPATEALVYGGLLRVLWKENKFADVVQVCRDGLRRTKATSHVLLYSELARALSRLDRMDEALAEADNAVRLAADTDRLTVRLSRVRLLAYAERYAAAEAECRTLLKETRMPGEVLEIRYVLSYIYSSAHQTAQAEEQLEAILKVDPNNATACNDLGYMWADEGKNLKEAEGLIRKALELERQQKQGGPPTAREEGADLDNAAYLDSLGWVLFRRGNVEEARIQLLKATTLPDGEDPVIWDHLGDVYQRLEMSDRAKGAWQRALHLYEQEKRRKMDQRYKDLVQKLKLLETQ